MADRPVPDKFWELATLEAHLVQRLGSMPRTKLVKLVYLIDERHYRLTGSTLTGLEYTYDDFGPNAAGNAIVKVGDLLDRHEISISKGTTAKGHEWFQYRPGPEPRFDPSFNPDVASSIDAIVEECGGMSVERIVAVAKATRPFLDDPKPGDRLRFTTLADDARARLAAIRRTASRSTVPDVDAAVAFAPEEPVGGEVDRAQRRALMGRAS